jgi:integral membrane protein (TIGR01906 family)
VNALSDRVVSILTGFATAVVIVNLAVLPFLTPQWVSFEQGRANAAAWTGFSTAEVDAATGGILSDLVFGPADFDGQVRGIAVLDERERGHMRDVKTVFAGLWLLGVASAVVLVATSRRGRRDASWRAVRRGAVGLAVGVVILGGVALVAFDALFEAFHQVLFPAGSYDFDPSTERLVQLFPFQFWQETAIVVGVLIVAICAGVAAFAGARVRWTAPAEASSGELAARVARS